MTKLKAAGDVLLFSSCFGRTGENWAPALRSAIYVVGRVSGTGFPLKNEY